LRLWSLALRLWGNFALWRRGNLALRLWSFLPLRSFLSLRLRRCVALRCCFARLLLRDCLALRRLLIRRALRRSLIGLPRLRLWRYLALRRRLISLTLRWLWICLSLRLGSCLPLRLRSSLSLRRLRSRLALLLSLYFPICRPQRWWGLHVVVGRERLVDGYKSRTTMIRAGKLATVGGGSALILDLCFHRRSVRLMHRRQLRRPRRRPDAARSAVVTHMRIVLVIHGYTAVIDVVDHSDVDVVDGAVVVEVASTPIAALIAVANVAKAVIDPAIVADVLAPISRVKAV
jgi:hypothetical protein